MFKHLVYTISLCCQVGSHEDAGVEEMIARVFCFVRRTCIISTKHVTTIMCLLSKGRTYRQQFAYFRALLKSSLTSTPSLLLTFEPQRKLASVHRVFGHFSVNLIILPTTLSENGAGINDVVVSTKHIDLSFYL